MLKFNKISGCVEWHSKKIARLSKSESLVFFLLLKKISNFASKEELLTSGWPDRFVSPNSLSVAIKNIRKALSGTDFNIETVHRKGYILHGDANRFTIIDDSIINRNDINDISTSEVTENEKTNDVNNRINNPLDIEESALTLNSNNISRQSAPAMFKRYHFLFSMRKAIIFSYYVIIIFLSLSIYIHTEDLYCYKVSPIANACGIFYLNDRDLKKLQHIISDKEGEFLYGYETNSHDFKIYKNN
ncbi:winged helix-turn-helix domain-containing protein [Aeromonas sp. Y318-1]|uniref:winged helix-turn-helix domain-containing protein n=1 Tax=Aeromonas TaxID=642 RepID=UPI0022E258DD|nr:winged helix-turn-helix domain-containing protein [Aeromonas sp. Y318-1]